MTGFWVGAFVALAAWKLFDSLCCFLVMGKTLEITHGTAVKSLGWTVLWLFLATLAYTGVIL